MLCNSCNREIDPNFKVCPYCGKELGVVNNAEPVQNSNFNEIKEEKANVGLVILSFIIPIAGLIIFITKKDKEPKTAKVSGICALVSFILNFVIGFAIFLIATINVNSLIDKSREDNNKHTDEIIEKGKNIIDNIEEKVLNDEEGERETLSSNWSDYKFSVNNKTMKLPCTYKELTGATGFKMKSAEENSSLSKNYYATVNMYKNDNLALYIEILNDTEGDIKYTDGKITRIWQSKYQVSTGADVVIFPGNIKAGDKMTGEEIINKYGQPNDKKEYSDSGYVSETYIYNENTNWTTTNYFEIKIVNGVIDEIILDHRN